MKHFDFTMWTPVLFIFSTNACVSQDVFHATDFFSETSKIKNKTRQAQKYIFFSWKKNQSFR